MMSDLLDGSSARLDLIPPEVRRLAAMLPRFPDQRLDYSASAEAVVVDCYVRCEGQLLILRRTAELCGVQKAWHVVSGYLDEVGPLRDKVVEEITEEIGPQVILSITAGMPYRWEDRKLWTVYPVGVEIAPGEIRLNEEHSAHAWIAPDDASAYLLPQVYRALTQLPW